MLDGIFGNKNIERILLFLFVNQKGYGKQMQKILGVPLTPIQNALARLKKGKIVVSYDEGKLKLYQMNPSYPLRLELEQLLKKTYTLLPPQEKKLYSFVQQESLNKRSQGPLLSSFWNRLKIIRQFHFIARSRDPGKGGWNGQGSGNVLIHEASQTVLIFHERGTWHNKEGQEIHFNNTLRWTLDHQMRMISLEHLRLGIDHPVFLFHLVPTDNQLLASVDSHLCEEDVYLATVPWDKKRIQLNWRVIGPKKNEEMEYYYT